MDFQLRAARSLIGQRSTSASDFGSQISLPLSLSLLSLIAGTDGLRLTQRRLSQTEIERVPRKQDIFMDACARAILIGRLIGPSSAGSRLVGQPGRLSPAGCKAASDGRLRSAWRRPRASGRPVNLPTNWRRECCRSGHMVGFT